MSSFDNEYDKIFEEFRSTDDPDKRREFLLQLAALDRERNRDIYDALAGNF